MRGVTQHKCVRLHRSTNNGELMRVRARTRVFVYHRALSAWPARRRRRRGGGTNEQRHRVGGAFLVRSMCRIGGRCMRISTYSISSHHLRRRRARGSWRQSLSVSVAWAGNIMAGLFCVTCYYDMRRQRVCAS